MSRARSIWLVARREILERGRSRGYLLSLAFTVVLLGAGFILPSVLIGDPNEVRIGLVGEQPPGLREALSVGATQFDANLEFEEFPDRQAGEAAIREDRVDVLLDVPADLSGPGELVVFHSVDDRVRAITGAAVVGLRQQALLEEAGVDPVEYGAASQLPETVALEPPDESEGTSFLFANFGIILMFIGIFSYGTWVLTGVVEEKQSRVVEVVLSTVRARDLLMGKVLGIGVLAVAQLVALVAIGLAFAISTGRLTLPETTPTAVVMLVVWFVLGFALYATALGFLGALASRQEEASNATLPVTMVAMLSYFAALFIVVDDPSGIVGRIMTFVPPSAVMVVPLRAALDAIEPWEIVLSVALTLVFIWGLFALGGRVYSGAVLRFGGRVGLRDAWRAAGE